MRCFKSYTASHKATTRIHALFQCTDQSGIGVWVLDYLSGNYTPGNRYIDDIDEWQSVWQRTQVVVEVLIISWKRGNVLPGEVTGTTVKLSLVSE